MFSKLTVFFVVTAAALVGALPTTEGHGSCSTGPVQCCNKAHSINDSESKSISGLTQLNIPVGTNVGFTCSPITGVGVGSNACTAQTVCCENNSFNGVVAIGCSPINISL